MNKKIYVIERQYIYNVNDRSLSDELYEFDNLTKAIEKLNELAMFSPDYLNDKNLAIEVVEYEVDENNEYDYIDVKAGFYGENAANNLFLNTEYMKTNKSTLKLLTRNEQIDLNLFK